MISKKLQDALNAQINAEMWSAYLYLSMSVEAESKGLKGFGNWFFIQFREEQDHARILMNYLLARGGQVLLAPIAEVRTSWGSQLEAFEDTLAHEKKVTAMINNLYDMAVTEKDHATANGSSTNRSRKKRAPRQSSTRSSSFQEIRWVYSCSTRSWRLALIRRQRPWPARSNRIHPQEKRIAENSAILFFMKPPVCIKNEIYN